jgi:hypothetical protein
LYDSKWCGKDSKFHESLSKDIQQLTKVHSPYEVNVGLNGYYRTACMYIPFGIPKADLSESNESVCEFSVMGQGQHRQSPGRCVSQSVPIWMGSRKDSQKYMKTYTWRSGASTKAVVESAINWRGDSRGPNIKLKAVVSPTDFKLWDRQRMCDDVVSQLPPIELLQPLSKTDITKTHRQAIAVTSNAHCYARSKDWYSYKFKTEQDAKLLPVAKNGFNIVQLTQTTT